MTDRDEVLADLRRVYNEGNLIIFAGAGVSEAGGLPGLKELAERLRDRVDREVTKPGTIEEIDEYIQKSQLIEAFSAIKHAMGQGPFGDAISRELADKGRDPPELAMAIAALRPKLRGVLTTNLDRFLEKAFLGEWDSTPKPTPDIAQRSKYIFKLHGTLAERDTWVFTREQHEHLMFASPAHRDAFDALYRACFLLFVGHDPSDGGLDLTLGAIRALAREQPPRHFAILPGPLKPHRRRMLDDAGVRLIEYDNHDGRDAEVLQILRDLADIPSVASSLTNPPRTGGAAMEGVTAPAQRPRVLVAGPYFGLSPQALAQVQALWREGISPERRLRIDDLLRTSSVEQAQIGAIVRHDLIIDLSPWRAFARWKSDGLRELEPFRRDDSGAGLVLFAFSEEKHGTPEEALAVLGQRLDDLWPLVEGRPGDRLASGVGLSGLYGLPAWWDALIARCPKVELAVDFPPPAEGRSIRRVERHDGTGADLTEREYLRALRVVAGQVMLAGEAVTRALRDVWMEVEIAPRGQRADDGGGSTDERGSGADDLAAELKARQEAVARMAAGSILSAEGVLRLARRVFIWGEAGTGKSTLLQWLACRTAQALQADGSERLPVWIPRPAVRPGQDLPDQLVDLALRALRLPVDRTSPICIALRARITGGNAHLFLDSLDEEDAARTALGGLSPGMHLHLASRPTQSLRGDYTEVELRGMTPFGAERFLHGYFGEARWIPSLLRELRELPDGSRWTRTPVLLSLAARLYQRKGQLPGSIVDLYAEVIGVTSDGDAQGPTLLANAAEERGLERPLDRVVRESGVDREHVVEELSRLALAMLAPEAGTTRVTFREGELPYELRAPLRRSGLFTGTEPLKFAHLTFGEYFAARCALDLTAARARWQRAAELSQEEGLEVLPMAHAVQGEPALRAALEDAEARDAPDHRMLRLLLRSLRYGGPGVRAFCEAYAAKVLELVLARMQMPSGRFGDAERRLLDAAEPALLVLAPFLKVGLGGPAGYRALLEPLLDVHGEAGTEAHVIAWTLGLRAPGRRSSRWWVTIQRVARALVRHGLGVSDVLELTEGSEPSERDDAVRILARFDVYRPLLLPLTWDRSMHLREDALQALDNPRPLPWIRERLWDDVGRVRARAVELLGTDHGSLDMVEEACLDDRHHFVQSAAIHVLAPHPQRWDSVRHLIQHGHFLVAAPAIRALSDDPPSRGWILERLTLEVEKPWSFLVMDAAFYALRGEPGLHHIIGKVLAKGKVYLDAATLKEFAKLAAWKATVLTLAENGNPAAICALADQEDHRPLFRRLLSHESEHTRRACIDALASDEESWPLLAKYLDDEEADQNAVDALKNVPAYRARIEELFHGLQRNIDAIDRGSHLRAQIVTALAGNEASRPLILSALKDQSSDVRRAAIEALIDVPMARGEIRKCLRDTDWRVRAAALDACADEPDIRGRLRSLLQYDDWALRFAAFYLLVDDAGPRQELRTLLKSRSRNRIDAIQPLSRDPESRSLLYALFDDGSLMEQNAAMTLLRGDPDLKRMARAKLNRALITKMLGWSENLKKYLELLGDDPESRSVFKDLFHDPIELIAVAVAPVMAHEPDSQRRFLELLRSEHAAVRAAAVAAVRPDPDVMPILRTLLKTDDQDIVKVAAATALATDEASLEVLHGLVTHPSDKVRTAAFRALSQHPPEQERLWERLAQEEKDELRAEIAEFLATQPAAAEHARPRMRARLSDPFSRVRIAAAKALAPRPAPAGVPLAEMPSLRLALHLSGARTERLSDQDYRLQTRMLEYVTQPTPLMLEDDPAFGEAVLGWLCVRLAWASPDGALASGRVFGELKEMPGTLLGSAPVIIRVAMDSSQLPMERWLHPTHNVIEAWQVAKQLRSRTSPTILLACADVDFADLVPPELAPGKASWGPTFFGFRLARPDTPETPGAAG